ncbi:ATP-binding protein [Mesorhizobium sp. M0060]|uniref:ATP-binding protein n=1 Tax=Mesorhizobium sp. M0060 TaxID=2956866 RepID=UPI00333A0652
MADAILDRIIHNAHRITLEGDSMRKQKTPPPLTGAENGEINRKWLQPSNRAPTPSCCPRISETAVRDLAERLSRFCEMRINSSNRSKRSVIRKPVHQNAASAASLNPTILSRHETL